jgi:hypothetical protein
MNDDNHNYEYLIYQQTNGTGRPCIMICCDDGCLRHWSGRGGEFATCYEAWRGLRYRHLRARVVEHNLIDLR